MATFALYLLDDRQRLMGAEAESLDGFQGRKGSRNAGCVPLHRQKSLPLP